jgi:hypothetical protein
MPAKSIKQQRFMGMVRAAQKGEGAASPEVAKVAASMKKKDAKDFASTKHKGLPMKKEEFINEEEADRLRDRRMERGGVDGNTRYPSKSSGGGGKKPEGKTWVQKQMEKEHGKGKSALDIVKAQIRAKHGDKAIIDTKKKANEGYAPGDVDQKVGAVTAIPKKEQDDARARILAKTKAKRAALKKEEVVFAGNYQGPLYAPHPDLVNEMPYQVYGSPDGKKEKKIGKPVKSKKYAADRAAELEDTHKKTGGKYRSEYTEETINERGDFWHPDPEKDKKLGGPGANQRAREDRADAAKPKKDYSKTTKPGESYMDYAKRKKAETSKRSTKYSPELQKRIDAAKAKKKEGIVGKIARKIGLKKEDCQKTYREFIAEGNRTGRMMQKSKSQVTGHISADRGDDEKKNREGRKTLEKDLKKHGIGHKKGVGEYKYGSGETGREVSYQTSKPEKMSKRRFGKVMRRLGRKHGQESVITKDKEKSAKLHYTEKGSKSKSDSIGKTKAGKHPEGYGETSGTKVRGGKLPKKTTKGAYHYG